MRNDVLIIKYAVRNVLTEENHVRNNVLIVHNAVRNVSIVENAVLMF